MTNLLDLAGACELATGADRSINKEIHRALHGAPELGRPNDYGWREDDSGWWLATGEDQRVPPKRISPANYTASIDAAMTLVPSGWSTALYWGEPGFQPEAQLETQEMRDRMGASFEPLSATAATPALALTAAALKALATLEKE